MKLFFEKKLIINNIFSKSSILMFFPSIAGSFSFDFHFEFIFAFTVTGECLQEISQKVFGSHVLS